MITKLYDKASSLKYIKLNDKFIGKIKQELPHAQVYKVKGGVQFQIGREMYQITNDGISAHWSFLGYIN